jgi:phage tail sheath gpL-like
MIDFSQIPLSILVPGGYMEFDFSQMQSGLPVARSRTLICGQKRSTGSGNANQAYRINSPTEAKALFGQGSMLAGMCAAYKLNDPTVEMWAIAVDDLNAGVAATKTITLTGPATAAGTLELRIQQQRVAVGVTVGMTATQLATAAAAAINAYPDLSYTAAANAAVVTLTARHKGVESNKLLVDYNYSPGDAVPAGITLAIAAGVAGTGNPDATSIFTAIGDAPYSGIVFPWADAANLTVFENACRDRADALKMNYSAAFTALDDSYANLLTLVTSRNSPFAPIGVIRGLPNPAWELAASYAAQVLKAARIDPGRPFKTLVLKGILPPKEANLFIQTEREFLLAAGGATFVIDAGGQVLIERVVTTYKTNALGFADTGLKDVNAILLLYYLSISANAYLMSKFPRHKLADDGVNYGPGQAIVTPKLIKAAIVALATLWAAAGLIENLDQFIDDLIVERDEADRNRVNARIRPDLINQFQTFAGLIQPIN